MSLFSISPIDGRYHNKVDDDLRWRWSEYGLIRSRLYVEVEWIKFLCACSEFPEFTALSSSEIGFLDRVVAGFGEHSARRVKTIEKTTMRRENIPNGYEKLKDITRGQKMTRALILDFIDSLETTDEVKREMRSLHPETYLGLAVELAKNV